MNISQTNVKEPYLYILAHFDEKVNTDKIVLILQAIYRNDDF